MLNFSEIKIRFFIELELIKIEKHLQNFRGA
jgi:hypothetical protein